MTGPRAGGGVLQHKRLEEALVKSVAITGISGYLGTQMLKVLDQDKGVETVVGIDIKPPSYSSAKLRF